MKNESFRIKSLIGEEATCWLISPYRLSVFWESGVHEFWNPKDMEDMIAHCGWEKLEESLPRSFKYYHIDEGPELVNTWESSGITTCWDGSKYDWWNADRAEDFISKGIWIVLPNSNPAFPSEPEDKMVERSNTTLEAIKSFTEASGHDVFISEGIYKVYRRDGDVPYICHSDEQVIAVMEALLMLDNVETEG